ncbi:MAG: type II toxin-antitoxin system RelE/ParE family toxin [Trueperaceae bacterium]
MFEDARDVVRRALHVGWQRKFHAREKPLRGLPGVYEIVADIATDTYRLVYSVGLPDTMYVLHAFKKKSNIGIATPGRDLDLNRARLRQAQEGSNER